MVKSLANTGASDYVDVQLRVNSEFNNSIKVQGRGNPVNRDYGVTGNVFCDPNFSVWLKEQTHTQKSLAGTKQTYVPAQVAIRGSKFHFQISGGPEFNRSYGAVLDVDSSSFPDLVQFVNDPVDTTASVFGDENDYCCHDSCCE